MEAERLGWRLSSWRDGGDVDQGGSSGDGEEKLGLKYFED